MRAGLRRRAPAVLIVLAAGFLLSLRLLGDNTIDFHLRGGRWILEHRAFPDKDPFTYAAADREYVDLHWLFQLAAYALYRVAGFGGLSVAGALLTVLLLALMAVRMRRLGAGDATSAWVLLASAVAMSHRYLMRPENVTYVYLALLGVVLDGYLRQLPQRGPRPAAAPGPAGQPTRRLWLVPLIQLLWVNTQGLFVVGWFVTAAYWAGASLRRRRVDRPLACALAASVAVSFANPYGARGFLFPWQLLTRFDRSNVFAQQVGEFQPLWLVGGLLEDVVLYGMAAALALSLALTARKRELHELLLPAPFLVLAVAAVRNVPLFVIVSAPILARALSDCIPALRHAGAGVRTASGPGGPGEDRPAGRVGLAVLCLVAAGMSLRVVTGAFYALPEGGVTARFGIGLDRGMRPVEGAEFLVGQGLRGRVLNSSNIGGWLGWALRDRVYLDMRLEVIGEALYREEVDSWSPGGLEKLLGKYRPQVVVLDHQGAGAAWVGQLLRLEDWRLVHVDGVTAIYARRDCAPAIPALDPRSLPARAGLSAATQGAVVEEILGRPVPSRGRRWFEGFFRMRGAPCLAERLGRLCLLLEEPGAAERLFLSCLEAGHDPDGLLCGDLGRLYATTGRPGQALPWLDRRLRYDPGDAPTYNERGIVKVMLGDAAGAIEDFGRSLSLDPKSVQAAANRGLARLETGDHRGAQGDFERALALDPGNATAREGIEAVRRQAR